MTKHLRVKVDTRRSLSQSDSTPTVQTVTEGTLPPGGTTDQFLKKVSSDDYDVEWSSDVDGGNF